MLSLCVLLFELCVWWSGKPYPNTAVLTQKCSVYRARSAPSQRPCAKPLLPKTHSAVTTHLLLQRWQSVYRSAAFSLPCDLCLILIPSDLHGAQVTSSLHSTGNKTHSGASRSARSSASFLCSQIKADLNAAYGFMGRKSIAEEAK